MCAKVKNGILTKEDLFVVIEDIAEAIAESGSDIAYANLLAVLDDFDIELD